MVTEILLNVYFWEVESGRIYSGVISRLNVQWPWRVSHTHNHMRLPSQRKTFHSPKNVNSGKSLLGGRHWMMTSCTSLKTLLSWSTQDTAPLRKSILAFLLFSLFFSPQLKLRVHDRFLKSYSFHIQMVFLSPLIGDR